jgi:YidC/Oxa1 family membrane protein insertase
MNLAIISLSLLDPLYIAFGWFMRILYEVIGNYGLVIIVFTIILRGLMIPMGIKQQKSTLKQQALQGEIAEIQRAYPNDKQKQSQMQMELYKKHGASPLSGCLPTILQLIIIWPIFRIIQAPLQYIMNIPADKIKQIGVILRDMNLITQKQADAVASSNIPIITQLNQNATALAKAVDGGLIKLKQLIDVDFLGINLGLTPTYQPSLLFGAELSKYLPLLIIPAIVLVTTLIQMKITRMTMPNRKKKAEAKEREKVNPARAGQTPEDRSESMMKSMNFIMPIFMLWTTFSMPAAMGLYWIIGNIMMILQSVLIYFMFTKKLDKTGAVPATPAPSVPESDLAGPKQRVQGKSVKT